MVPGGALEWGETLEEAAVREVREETGIDIEIETFVEMIEAITPGDSGFHYVIMDYAAHERSRAFWPRVRMPSTPCGSAPMRQDDYDLS